MHGQEDEFNIVRSYYFTEGTNEKETCDTIKGSIWDPSDAQKKLALSFLSVLLQVALTIAIVYQVVIDKFRYTKRQYSDFGPGEEAISEVMQYGLTKHRRQIHIVESGFIRLFISPVFFLSNFWHALNFLHVIFIQKVHRGNGQDSKCCSCNCVNRKSKDEDGKKYTTIRNTTSEDINY